MIKRYLYNKPMSPFTRYSLCAPLLVLAAFFVLVSPNFTTVLARPLSSTPAQGAAPPPSSSKFMDAMIVIDDIYNIFTLDPNGDRYVAARLFVDLAVPGDKVGIVQVPAAPVSPADLENQTKYPSFQSLTTINNSDDEGKHNLLADLSNSSNFDNAPGNAGAKVAYFVPALQAAADQLHKTQDLNKKYIILITDVLGQSVDPNPGNCQSPLPDAQHYWLCEIDVLKSDQISVDLVGFQTNDTFSDPTAVSAFDAMQKRIRDNGGIVQKVAGGASGSSKTTDTVADLGKAFVDLFSQIHSNIYEADIPIESPGISIDPSLQLDSLTVVALGDSPSLDGLQVPDPTHPPKTIAPDQKVDTGNSGFYLKLFKNGPLNGKWSLKFSNPLPTKVLVVANSSAYLDILKPDAENPDSSLSNRYIPAGAPVVLQAQITTDSGGDYSNPPAFGVIEQNTVKVSFSLQGPNDNTSGTILNAVSTSADLNVTDSDQQPPIQIGFTQKITSTPDAAYLTRSFNLRTLPDLPTVTNPTYSAPGKDGSVTVSSAISASANQPGTSTLSLYWLDNTPNAVWNSIGNPTQGATISGVFHPKRGCGYVYTLIAAGDFQGSAAGHLYHYLTTGPKNYPSELPSETDYKAPAPDPKDLGWFFQTTVTWKMTFHSTSCQDAPAALTPTWTSSAQFPQPEITWQAGSGYHIGLAPTTGHVRSGPTVGNEAILFQIPGNGTLTFTVTFQVGTCNGSLFPPDKTGFLGFNLTKSVAPQEQFDPDFQQQIQFTCPSGPTEVIRNAIIIIPGFLIFLRLGVGFLGRITRKKPGLVVVRALVSDPQQNGAPQPLPHEIYFPKGRHPVFYLNHVGERGGEQSYQLDTKESVWLLKFYLGTDKKGSEGVIVEASQYGLEKGEPHLRTGATITKVPSRYYNKELFIHDHWFLFTFRCES